MQASAERKTEETALAEEQETIQTVEICQIPFPSQFVENTKVVYVKKNSKFENLHRFASEEMKKKETRHIIFRGYGEACEKCISCVEVFKRNNISGKLYQWNKAKFSKSTTVYPPAFEGAKQKVVEKQLPTLFILISKDPFPEELQCGSMQTSEDVDVFAFKRVAEAVKKRQFDQTRSIKRMTGNVNKWKRQVKESKRAHVEKNRKGGAAKKTEE
ncbi:hypothetical protein L596_018147 [Steinernema carpocapsae]|uniref:DNA/RNA-binding protein Alba-like domain-containing protein n=1 Tax=Steinernema carpocapsae TaxID=34508 RepID=A0A4U5N446_STECR|nr:hypothetical protein L596_018147 [Steinernema carpocapsae]